MSTAPFHLEFKTNQPTTSAIQALNELLRASEVVRHGLRSLLSKAGISMAALAHYDTPSGSETDDQHHLICSDENDTQRLIIHGAFWEHLHSGVPNQYLAALPEHGPSALLVVVPTLQIVPAWYLLCERAGQRHQLGAAYGPAGLRTIAIGTKTMMITSWSILFERLRQHAALSSDTTPSTSIQKILDFVEQIEHHSFLPIQLSEMGPDLPRRVMNLAQLIDDAAARAVAQGCATVPVVNNPQRHGYGVHITLRNLPVWFGINFDLWITHRILPLWIHNPSHEGSNHQEWTPIQIPTEVEYNNILDDVVAQLNAYSRGQTPRIGLPLR